MAEKPTMAKKPEKKVGKVEKGASKRQIIANALKSKDTHEFVATAGKVSLLLLTGVAPFMIAVVGWHAVKEAASSIKNKL